VRLELLKDTIYLARDVAQVLEDALALPPEARAALAGSLLDSLETECDPEIEAAWLVEIQRRSAELDPGAVSPVPWREVDALMQATLKRGS